MINRLPVIILPKAKADIGASARYFDEVRPGHGQEFIHQINASIQHIRDFPESCQRFQDDCRRVLLHRFKHALVYRRLPTRIEIVGVLDDRRDLSVWTPRTGD